MVFCCNSAQAIVEARFITKSDFEPTKARAQSMIIIGHTTPTSAKIWAKVPTIGSWSVILSTGPINGTPSDSDDIISLTHVFEDDGLNYCFEFIDLIEDTTYYYILVQDSTNPAQDNVRPLIGGNPDEQEYFKTAKSAYDDSGVTFSAYSCHDPYSWEKGKAVEGAWALMSSVKNELDFTIGSGDQVYVDSNEVAMTDIWTYMRDSMDHIKSRYVHDGNIDKSELSNYLTQLIREYYQIYWNFPNLSEVYRRVPSYMMWDDHEIMDGWGSVNQKERVIKLKQKTNLREVSDEDFLETMAQMTFTSAAQVYYEYQHSHNPGKVFNRGEFDPCTFTWDYSFNRGAYHFYVLDMRGAHDCDANADRLLGSSQHERLQKWLDGLESSGAKSAFIISPVPVVHWSSIVEYAQYFIPSLKDDLMDAWQHPTNHVERAKLLKALFTVSNKLKIPFTIVSGDVHCASAYTLSDKTNYPHAKILQVTASSISRIPVNSFGTVAFARNCYIKERLNDGKGKIVHTSIYQKQVFAKAGVNNFAMINAKDNEVNVTFYWVEKDGKTTNSAKVNIDKW